MNTNKDTALVYWKLRNMLWLPLHRKLYEFLEWQKYFLQTIHGLSQQCALKHSGFVILLSSCTKQKSKQITGQSLFLEDGCFQRWLFCIDFSCAIIWPLYWWWVYLLLYCQDIFVPRTSVFFHLKPVTNKETNWVYSRRHNKWQWRLRSLAQRCSSRKRLPKMARCAWSGFY